MPTNYNFRNKIDYLKLKFPNVSSSGRRLFLHGDQSGMAPGPNQENAAFRFANTSVVSLDSANLSPGKENEALRITPIGTNNPWQAIALYVGLTPRPDNLDFVGGTTRTYRISFSYRANASSIGKTFSINLSDNPFGGSGSVGYGLQNITIVDTNWNRVENISQSRTFATDRWIGFSGFRALSPNNTWTSSDWLEIADFSFTWDEQPVTTTSFDDQFIPADTFRQGNLLGWGTNDFSPQGIFTSPLGVPYDGTSRKSSPIPIGTYTRWKSLTTPSATGSQMYGIDSEGYLWFWGLDNFAPTAWPRLNTTGNRSVWSTPTFESNTDRWIQVARFGTSGPGGGVAIKTDGTLWSWGNNTFGQLAINNTTNSQTLVREFTSSSNWKSVAGGEDHISAIKTDGTLWSWGLNEFGQLGINDNISRSTPVQEATSSNNWTQVVCGCHMSASIKSDGSLWIWGSTDDLFTGIPVPNGTVTSSPTREYTSSLNWKNITCTSDGNTTNVRIVKTDGTAWKWPRFTNETKSIVQYATTANMKWAKAYGSADNDFLIASDTSLWGQGTNAYGELGLNDRASRATPVPIQSLTNVKSVMINQFGRNVIHVIRYIDPII